MELCAIKADFVERLFPYVLQIYACPVLPVSLLSVDFQSRLDLKLSDILVSRAAGHLQSPAVGTLEGQRKAKNKLQRTESIFLTLINMLGRVFAKILVCDH